VYGGQSSEGLQVDHHLLLNKQRNDIELNRDVDASHTSLQYAGKHTETKKTKKGKKASQMNYRS